jgi:hypothetical protein
MDGEQMTRRGLLAAAAGLGVGLRVTAAPAEEPFPKDAAEVRQRLIEGNKRFVAGESIYGHTSKGVSEGYGNESSQAPYTAALAASHSFPGAPGETNRPHPPPARTGLPQQSPSKTSARASCLGALPQS